MESEEIIRSEEEEQATAAAQEVEEEQESVVAQEAGNAQEAAPAQEPEAASEAETVQDTETVQEEEAAQEPEATPEAEAAQEAETAQEEEAAQEASAEKSSAYSEEKRARFEKSKELKRGLIEEARALLSSTEWKKGTEKQKELMDRWKQAGYAAEENETLWEEFQSVRDTFFEARKKHFEEMEELRKKAAEEKKALIKEVTDMVFSAETFDEDAKAMDDIFARWKQAGFAGKDINDSLWDEFNKAREPFLALRGEHRKQQEAVLEEKRKKKQELIDETRAIIESGKLDKDTTERIKELGRQWKEIGFSGRQGSQELWDAFKEAQDDFWNAKKERAAKRNEERVESLRSAIAHRQQRISKIKENIDNLTSRMMQPGNNKAGQFLEYITQDQEQIESLKSEINEINEKIAAIESAE